MMKKFFCAACAVMAMSVFADAPAPAAEFKFNEGDLQAIKCTNPAVTIKAGNTACLGWGEGRLDGKAVEFKNNFPNNKRGGMGYFGIPTWGSKLNQPFTITTWAKLDAGCKNNGPQYTIFSTAKSDYGPGIRLFYSWGSYRLMVGNGTAKGYKTIATSTAKQPFDTKAWNHLAATYDGSKVSLYINGTLVGSVDFQIIPGTNYINIGTYSNGFAYGFLGWMQDFKIYNAALTAEQVLAESQAE